MKSLGVAVKLTLSGVFLESDQSLLINQLISMNLENAPLLITTNVDQTKA